MMRCDRVCQLLSEYQLGGLTRRLRRGVEKHLSQCPSCTAELVALLDVDARLRQALGEEPAPDLWPHVVAEMSLVPVRVKGRWKLALIPAGATVAAVVAWFAWPRAQTPSAPLVEAEPQIGYEQQHVMLGWGDPLADRVHIGLVGLEDQADEAP